MAEARGFVTMEFHISRPARERYGIDAPWFSLTGNVVLADLATTRRLALRMNQARGAARHPERTVQAGELHAMGLIDEILHYVVGLYREQAKRDAMAQAIAQLEQRAGRAQLDATLRAFGEAFPPLAVYRGEVELAVYLAGATAGVSHREIMLEELLLLWLANSNPAFGPFRELFDDTVLADTSYAGTITALGEFFASLPPFGPDHQSLVDMLRSPALAAPDSLAGQLEYIRTRWGHLLGEFLKRLLVTLDVIREDERAQRMRFAPRPSDTARVPVATFGGLEAETERFTPDRDWMPNVVLIAKSAHVWLDQLSRTYGRAIQRLDEIPDEELARFARWGVSALWLIGLWERSPASRRIKQMCGNPDADASAYSLLDYRIADTLGGDAACAALRERAWRHGIRLASDMVPNHMGIDSRWVMDHPDWFVSLEHSPYPGYTFEGADLSWDSRVGLFIEDHYYDRTDAAVVFKRVDRHTGAVRYIYHGNDGTATPWNDTAQLDYLRADVREAVIQTILHVARQFPVIRLDAAMTLAKRHFQRLWFPEPGGGGAIPSRAERGLTKEEFDRAMPVEFWREVVDRVAAESPDTLLLAEAFWLMEGYFVRTLGMHRVYNSAFMNMLRDEENANYRSVIKNTIEFDAEILKRYVNFMSNPDERTAVDQFGTGDKYFGVCTLMVTLPGLPMFGHGQIEGFTERYGMEFRRAGREETPDRGLVERHEREIFPLVHRRQVFADAREFRLYDFFTDGGHVNEDVFAYSNRSGGERGLVLYHNRYASTAGWIRTSVAFAVKAGDEKVLRQTTLGAALGLTRSAEHFCIFRDVVSGFEYLRSSLDIHERGLHAQLEAYQCQVFLDFREVRNDAEHPWAALAAELGGRGALSIDAALDELRLRPVLTPFRELVNADVIRRLIAARERMSSESAPAAGGMTMNGGQGTGSVDAAVPGTNERATPAGASGATEARARSADLAARIDRLVHAVQAFARGSGDPAAVRHEIATRLEALLTREGGGGVSDAAFPTLVGWVFVHSLGGVMGADATVHSREWLRAWGWDRALEDALQGLGESPGDAARRVAMIDAMIGHSASFRSAAAPAAAAVPVRAKAQAPPLAGPRRLIETLLADERVQRVLQVNEHGGTRWFNQEVWEELIGDLAAAATLETRCDRALEGATIQQYPDRCQALAADLIAAANEAGYRLDTLVAKFVPIAR